MLRPISEDERDRYNQVVNHPLQTWEWGEFRKKTGLKVERVGTFTNGELEKAFQVTFHSIPVLGGTAGYLPKAYMPDEDQLSVLKQLGDKNRTTFIKLEPDVSHPVDSPSSFNQIDDFLQDNQAKPGRPLFTRYTYKIDLTKPETELFEACHQKTRYNIRLAVKKGVTVQEATSQEGLTEYLNILKETTKRQGFYAHTPEYFQTMWDTIGQTGMMRIFHAVYEGQVLVAWIVFLFKDQLYYPYGASRSAHRDVMASNLMMWEMIRFGQLNKCKSFDLWGCLGPDAKKNHPWYGFHKFKEGYGGTMHEFLGSYDLMLNIPQYQIFRLGENIRWKLLRIKTKIGL